MCFHFDGLTEDLKNEPFIFFIGNGVSRLFGAKGWDEVCRILISRCYELDLFQTTSDKVGLEELLDNPNEYPSIIGDCKRFLVNNGYKEIYKEIILESLPNQEQDKIFNIIYSLSPHAIVTTNIDEQIPIYSNYRKCNLITSEIPRGKGVFYLHGRQSQFESIIFTREDYIRHYRKREISNFVQQLFSYSILFIGYGLEEYQILDAIGNQNIQSSTNKIYRLCPELDIHKIQIRIKNRFLLNDYGIETIGYSVEKGYDELYNVLRKIENTLNLSVSNMTDFETKGKPK
ncbi:MAG: SIR2 family protein [Bacteroidetes bacterium]|nr:SIR2 family protein [Bacteroidota bacterium]